jgi:hypothetical protein
MNGMRAAVLILGVALAVCLMPTMILVSAEDRFVAEVSPVRDQVVKAIRKKGEITLVALGDSHAALGFYPNRPDGYSLAYAGEGVWDMAVRVDWMLKSLPNIRRVAIELQPHLFFANRAGLRGTAAMATSTEWSLPQRILVHLSEQFHPCCRAAAPEWLVRNALGFPKPAEPAVLANGYMLYDQTRKPLQSTATLEIASYQGRTSAMADLQEEFASLVKRFLDRGIDVALVHYPLSHQYRDRLGPAAFSETDAFARSLLAKYPKLILCGAWDWSDDDPSVFLNSDHLTLDGARAYWQSLSSCLGADDLN